MPLRSGSPAAVLGAVTAGTAAIVAVVALGAAIADGAAAWHAGVLRHSPAWGLLLTPLGFAALAWATRRWFPGAEGGGIPQAMAAARAPQDAPANAGRISLRIAAGKVALSIAGFACGTSLGREGPNIQIGASLLYSLRGIVGASRHVTERGLILAGAAAGIAATFGAPLAGVVFGFEQMARAFAPRKALVLLGVAVLAGIAGAVVSGNHPYFGRSTAAFVIERDWPAVLLCGLAGGLLGGAFGRALLTAQGWLRPWTQSRPVATAAVLGTLLALIGLLSATPLDGSGYAETQRLLSGAAGPDPLYPVLKFFATLLSALSGIPGGMFSPSLAVGAGFGAGLAPWLAAVPLGTLAILGMAAYQSGVTQTPLTATVIVVEMLAAPQLALPVLATALIAMAISRQVCREPLYEALCRQLLAAGAAVPDAPTRRAISSSISQIRS